MVDVALSFRAWVRNREVSVALLVLPALAIFNFWRFSAVNPVILGDEYIYSVNSRLVSPWGEPVEGDYSNYLFNALYSPTNLCGDAFYQCAKGLNGLFFFGFILVLFIVALKVLPRWWSLFFSAAISVSPLSVYTSMFLPETLFFFSVSLILMAVLRAMQESSYKSWALVGILIGVASLVKPHAWLTAVAVGILLTISSFGFSSSRLVRLVQNVASISIAAILTRLLLGVLIAGPKAVGFFGAYLSVDVINSAGEVDLDSGAIGTGPLNGALSLFPQQFGFHLFAITALIGVALVGLILGVISLLKGRDLDTKLSLALVAFIWLATLMTEIVLFTGWVTGGGDDHTTRILLRYYEFLIPIALLGGVGVLAEYAKYKLGATGRWVLVALFVAILSQAFSGIFGTLTLQIADAPWLAGLVVNYDLYSFVAIVGMISLLLFATFPRYSGHAAMLILLTSSALIGSEISSQYVEIRGVPNAADVGGKAYGEFVSSTSSIQRHLVVANTRFDATLAALWANSTSVEYGIFPAGTTLDYSLGEVIYDSVLVLGDIDLVGAPGTVQFGNGFKIYNLNG